ncbi:MAG: hypothetical protein GF330_06720 [Candidatus Eisenbacteria bacterium]|nr:hypothetical protein [Candidatus Eisenbacteria bacterium]
MAGSKAPRKSRFNPSLTLPVIDIIAAVLIVIAAAVYWMHSRGEERVTAAELQLEQTRAENAELLAEAEAQLQVAEREHQQMVELEEIRREQLDYIEDQIVQQREAIIASRERDEPLMQESSELCAEIDALRDQRSEQRREIRDFEQQVEETDAVVAALSSQTIDRQAEVSRTNQLLQEPPPSRFPATSAVALLAGLGERENDYLLALSRGLTFVRGWQLGLQGSFGLGERDRTVIEAGLFANLPLPIRGLSFDLVAGYSHLSGSDEQPSGSDGLYGAHLRFAPRPHERFHIVAGAVQSHEETQARLGISFGGR